MGIRQIMCHRDEVPEAQRTSRSVVTSDKRTRSEAVTAPHRGLGTNLLSSDCGLELQGTHTLSCSCLAIGALGRI